MDRLIRRFEAAVAERFSSDLRVVLKDLAPPEMQGFGGMLRGAFALHDGSLLTVRLSVAPWDTGERWEAMVCGREMGERAFWEWLPDSLLCRVPFLWDDFMSHCTSCGGTPCIHGAALAYHWLIRVSEHPEFLLLFLNRRGLNRHPNVNAQPIARVPVGLGTNLDRTRRELVAIIESALKAAGHERDNLFGGDFAADSGNRD